MWHNATADFDFLQSKVATQLFQSLCTLGLKLFCIEEFTAISLHAVQQNQEFCITSLPT